MSIKRHIGVSLCLLFVLSSMAERWTTHFAYNDVTQLAMAPDKVFGLSDGNLFSVEKQTEQIKTYGRQSGLHASGITCIAYDQTGKQLIIGYETGKIDLLSDQGAYYIGDLYDKDMTQRKTIYNVTFHGRTAYLSTHYGIQTLNLNDRKLVDSYWLRPGGQETPIADVLIANDSIYAFTTDSLFCAAMSDNLVDYHYWKRELRTGRISPEPYKGVFAVDEYGGWWATGQGGIVLQTRTGLINYKPNGPQNNMPYRLTASHGKVWVVPGGRWASQNYTPGVIMHYNGEQWSNIPYARIKEQVRGSVNDFMNVAVDPHQDSHLFVTSYGTGLYEFIGDSVANRYIADGVNLLGAAAPADPANYTRLDYATYDSEGNLWFMNAGSATAVPYQLICIDKQGEWHGLRAVEGSESLSIPTPTGLIIDKLRPNYKWFSNGRDGTCLCLLDDGGTRWDASDDRLKSRFKWTDQNGQDFYPSLIFGIAQDAQGRIWIASDAGTAYIDPETDYFTSDACVRPDLMDENGENPLLTQQIQAFCQTQNGDVWVGTKAQGIYVLDREGTQIMQHFSSDNTAMPSNSILSLACDENDLVWVGTGNGLVSYDPNGSAEGLYGSNHRQDGSLDMGSMRQWRLHLSYNSPTELAASSSRIYAQAQGSLFYLDRATDQLEYLSRATGLKGSTASHIAYDPISKQLVIAYEDGRIDLLDDEDNVRQMPDLQLKAGSMAVTVNCITPSKEYTYLGTAFGIMALNTKKAEIADTYYIGHEASSRDVQQIVVLGDTIFAFSYDTLYKACKRDNLLDYSFWHGEHLPCEQVQRAVLWRDRLYALYDNKLYRRVNTTWQLIDLPVTIQWIHANDGQLLLYTPIGLFLLSDEEQLIGLTNSYLMNDAIYSNGEFWAAETNKGLVRLKRDGDEYFHTDGPNSNFGYSMFAAHDQLYTAIGGRWAAEWLRPGKINIYNGQSWRSINESTIVVKSGKPVYDIVSLAVDPNDPGHFFAATYGTGVFEFFNYGEDGIKQYTADTVYHTTTLREVIPNIPPLFYYYYIRTDGAMMDNNSNLWVLNATDIGQPLHIMTPDGKWHAINLRSNGTNITLTTPTGIWIDRRNENRKWLLDQRDTKGVILLDDGGTPTRTSDDRCIKRESFTDQNGNVITPTHFRCWVQDHTNRIWIGTEKGILTIPAKVDFFTSDACHRIIIPRNDGTGLGDYLLGNEQINCMAVDGGNRMWIGTANSGLYLIEDDTITVAHFTDNNSLLPSNTIQSIAIMPKTGEVFVGTDRGIASYRSDASEPQENMSGVYAFPNPVRPDYGGYISITGLTENTTVNIIDSGGNLVCKTRSNGGTAVWDGKLPDGRRATPGVYTALCNSEAGHAAVKILVIR